MRRPFSFHPKRNKDGFRSGFESRVNADLKARGIEAPYEQTALTYIEPAKSHTYTPDFQLPGGAYLEVKGYLPLDERQKLMAVRESNPGVPIFILFQRASNPIYKGSKTTYGQWATKNGFDWAEGRVPERWVSGTGPAQPLQGDPGEGQDS